MGDGIGDLVDSRPDMYDGDVSVGDANEDKDGER
jgi:hypothetical protein